MTSREEQQIHLFTIRLWLDADGSDQTRWRGKLVHVQSGHTRYFQDWAALVPILRAMLRADQTPHQVSTSFTVDPPNNM
ncbi:MAG TPA: hypothetical protein PLD25_19750 [Chloroflexota bacterium]|nr:hypothetical protein [Chloroflexota bacterium]HUM68617.1 hypothetical protein [Chloroflexota bacterium]